MLWTTQILDSKLFKLHRLLTKPRQSVIFILNTQSWALGWVDIGTGTKVPLRFVTYLSKIAKINEKSILTQWPLHHWSKHFGSCTL
jgi:hypothetical protein